MNESISTKNVNEATYYVLCGGIFEKASQKTYYMRKYRVQSQPKTTFRKWNIHVKDVPPHAIDSWWQGCAIWDIRDFMKAREILKKQIVLYLHGELPDEKSVKKCNVKKQT